MNIHMYTDCVGVIDHFVNVDLDTQGKLVLFRAI